MNFLRRLLGGGSSDAAAPTVERPAIERRDLRAEALPAGYQHLIQGPSLDVVAESKYRAQIEQAVGRRPEGHRDVVDAALVWEPRNRYDPNAITVQIQGRTCGYLPREVAARYRPVMEWCRDEGFVPVVRADVSGGWQQSDGSWADFGIRVYVASPRKLLGSEVSPSLDHPWVGQMIAFTGGSHFALSGVELDREWSEEIAGKAGMTVHPRVTKKVQLLVDCDPTGSSGNERKATDYGIPVVSEGAFWAALGLPVEELDDDEEE